ncbi:hypothetical protein HDU97_009344 [Phlyctochytrium planicorne]|nr:hypothetical protein HDU97_009344 [Phlyctochytrium planicorne]
MRSSIYNFLLCVAIAVLVISSIAVVDARRGTSKGRPAKPVREITPAGRALWARMRDHILRGDAVGTGGHHTYRAVHAKWPRSQRTSHTHNRQDVYNMNIIDNQGNNIGRKTVFGQSWSDAQVAEACEIALSRAPGQNVWVTARGRPKTCITTTVTHAPGTCYPDTALNACGRRV